MPIADSPERRFVERWHDLAESLGVDGASSDRVLTDLVARHGETHRSYHTHEHIVAVLEELDVLNAATAAAQLAAFFHDAIYDAAESNNEERSARLAKTSLTALAVDSNIIAETYRLICATAGHQLSPGAPAETAAFLDADLAILGAPADRYDQYVDHVRIEYRHVDEATWRSGRRNLLERFVSRDRLFFTESAHGRLEASARSNLARELAALAD